MNLVIKSIKVFAASAAAALSAIFGILTPFLLTLFICMLTDYITGMYAASVCGEVNSYKGMRGIVKKLFYFVAVAVGVVAGSLIETPLGFELNADLILGSVVAVWLIVNELISITENLGRIGVPLPSFLSKILLQLKDKIDDKANKNTEGKMNTDKQDEGQ